MRFIRIAVLSVLALLFVYTTAAIADEKPYPFTGSHPTGYPAFLLSGSKEFAGVFKIGPEIERMNLTEAWEDAKLRKVADDEVMFYLGKLRYVSYLNNLCGGTPCTVTANIRVYVSREQERIGMIVRMTLNGSSSYMESYMYRDSEGSLHVYSLSESGWLTKTDTAEEASFLGISEAAIHLVGKAEYLVR